MSSRILFWFKSRELQSMPANNVSFFQCQFPCHIVLCEQCLCVCEMREKHKLMTGSGKQKLRNERQLLSLLGSFLDHARINDSLPPLNENQDWFSHSFIVITHVSLSITYQHLYLCFLGYLQIFSGTPNRFYPSAIFPQDISPPRMFF